MPRSPAFSLFLIALTLFVYSPVAAQIGGGGIVGNVSDSTGAAVVGANVAATNLGTNQKAETVTNGSGYYEFPLLPAGRYVVEVKQAGFQNARTAELGLNSGTQPRVDFQLTLATVVGSVEVVATVPLVNSTTTDIGTVIDNKKIETLPLNGRSFNQLLNLQAGVVNAPSSSTGGRGGIEFHGSPAYGNNLLLDGVDMSFGENNAVASSAGAGSAGYKIVTVSIEAVQEFKATGGAFSAEYGRATGGVVNLVTKSGSNQFHGTLFEFFRNNKLDANNFFTNRSGLPRPPLRWNQYGGNLGGPILRDRLFFFFNYEGATTRQPTPLAGNVPTALLISKLTPALQEYYRAASPTTYAPTSDPYIGFATRTGSSQDDENTYLGRVDVRLGRHQLSTRYNYNDQNYSSPFFGLIWVNNSWVFPFRYHNAAVQDAWTISPSLLNELRVGFNRTNLNRFNTNFLTQPGYVSVASAGFSDYVNRLNFISNSYTLADNFTIVRGKHTFKVGTEIRDLRTHRIQATKPESVYNSIDDLIADNPLQIYIVFGNPGRGLNTTSYGFFGQDDWRLSRRLQVNLGLRYDYFSRLTGAFNVASSNPLGSYIAAGEPMFAPDRNNFGPRAGFVFDAFGNQKTVVRAGAGISYVGPQPFFYYNMGFISPSVPFDTYLAPESLPPGFSSAFPFPQALVTAIQNDPSLLPQGLILGRNVADYHRRDEYSERWNISIQQAINPKLAVQASYLGNRGLNLWSSRPLNLYDPLLGRSPDPSVGVITWQENAGRSSYNALQLQVNQQYSKRLSFDFYYTWSHTMEYYNSDAAQEDNPGLQDPNNIAASVGPKDGEVRHRIVGVYSYDLPTPRFADHSTFGRTLLGGWVTQGILSWRSGLPVNVLSGVDLAGNHYAEGQRPDVVQGVPLYLNTSDPLAYFNPAAFTNDVPLAEQRFGNVGYNVLRGPSAFGWDASLHKNFRIREGHTLTFRWELFSILNHPIFGSPVNTLTDPNFGRITSSTGQRNIQLALKYAF